MIDETSEVVERFLRYANEEARRVVRRQEIGGIANFEDIAADSCLWAIASGVLGEWEQRGTVEDDERQLRALARKSVCFRALEAKRAARNPRRRFQRFFVNFNTDLPSDLFEVVDERQGDQPRSAHDARLRREAPEVTRITNAEQLPRLWSRWREIIAGLPEDVRPCVDLVLRERKTYKRAAEELGLRMSTVRMRVTRHRERIAHELGDDFRELM
jgi:DNA-directed RNA polymerase specialized sigma24 family protein